MLGFKYTYNGYTWNDFEDTFAALPYFSLEQVTGFSSPSLRHQQQSFLGLHGFEDHFSFVGGRFIVFRGKVVGTN